MIKTKRNLLIVIIVGLIVILGMGITSILAWLTDNKEIDYDGETSQFQLSYDIYFDQGEGLDPIPASQYYIGDDESEDNLKLIQMSLGDQNAPNFIGKLRINISVTTNGNYYLRVKFNNEWYMARRSMTTDLVRYSTINQSGDTLMPYTLASNWYYDQASAYTYYTQPVNNSSVLPVINGPMTKTIEYKDYTTTSYETKYYVYLDVKFEYVQANRMYAIWNLDHIPQAQ